MANGTLKVSNIQTSSGSGTVTLGQSGETVALGSGATSSGNFGNFDKLEDINVTSDVSGVEINLDYSGYTAFKLIIKQLNKSGTSSSNVQFRVKRSGQSSFDSGASDYGNQGILYDNGTNRNDNNNVNSIAMLTGAGTGLFTLRVEALITGAQETDIQFQMQGVTSIAENGGSTSTYGFGGTRYNNTEKVTAIQITDTAQNIGVCIGTLYGLKA